MFTMYKSMLSVYLWNHLPLFQNQLFPKAWQFDSWRNLILLCNQKWNKSDFPPKSIDKEKEKIFFISLSVESYGSTLMKVLIFSFFLIFGAQAQQGCPQGSVLSFSGAVCWFLINVPMDFTTSERYCRDLGGNLTSIHNAFDNIDLAS